ncbi:MAG: hypothetical protein GJ676_14825 [Rhodobacteraceae bacterium]|nr:hypothetical protein [Paracoccaceae bacterium]
MVNEAIVHVGMHKTGSSSIQRSLVGYDDGHTFYAKLMRANHSVPIYTAFSSDFSTYHVWRKRGLSSAEVSSLRLEARREFVEQLENSERQRIIISGEDISLLTKDDAAEFLGMMTDRGISVQVVFYARDPLGFAASMFQQMVKAGEHKIPAIVRPDYRVRLQKFSEILGRENIHVHNFDPKSFPQKSVVRHFCQEYGLDLNSVREKLSNDGVSGPAVKLPYRFNQTNVCFYGDKYLFEARHKMIRLLASAYEDSSKLPKELFGAIADQSDLDYLASEFGLEFPSTGTVSRSVSELENWLADFSDVDLSLLADLVQRVGVKTPFTGPDKLLNRMFYQLVHDELSQANAAFSLSDMKKMRDIALNYETGQPVTREQAIYLMEIANQISPDRKFILKKLGQWRSGEAE